MRGRAQVYSLAIKNQTGSVLSILSFNILYGGTHFGQPLNQTAKVIETAGADVAVLCEHMGSAQPLADLLALHCHEVTAPPYRDSVAVLSRFPVIETFDHGVRLALTEDETACVFGVHLSSSPYQPYQVRDGAFSRVEDVVANAETTRGREIDRVLAEIAPRMEKGERVFLCGDFNEPSHLDWTDRSAAAGFHFKTMVPWPCSSKIIASGMVDSLRAVYPDECDFPAVTWTTVPGEGVGGAADVINEVHDRIDFVYHAGGDIRPVAAEIIGENEKHSDLVVVPYPSDHRAVVVRFCLNLELN